MNPMATSREEILEVIRELIRRQGWEAVNVRAVASACGVAVGTLYNYFPSRDALVAASVESVWKDIFHHGDAMEDFGDILSCVRWLYRRMEYGAQRYPNFFSLHALNFGEGEKAQGRRQMLNIWEHIRLRLSAVAAQDPNLRPGAFGPSFTADQFAGVLFSLMLSALLRRDYDPSPVLEICRRTLYRT